MAQAQFWFVINGQQKINGAYFTITRVSRCLSYSEIVDVFQRDYPLITCINSDRFREGVAKSYNVPYLLEEVTTIQRD